MTTPLQCRDINGEGDKICKPAPTQVAQETQDDNDDVELQIFWGAKRCNYHGFVSRIHRTIANNSCRSLIYGTNIHDSLTNTCTWQRYS
jgi:hypothetical protein